MIEVAVYCGLVVKQFRLFVYHFLVVAKEIRVLFVERLIPKSLDVLPQIEIHEEKRVENHLAKRVIGHW